MKRARNDRASKKPAKDPDEPKSPATAFYVFLEEFRKQQKEKHPNINIVNLEKICEKKWKSMSESEKAPYVAMAKKSKSEYNKKFGGYFVEKEKNQAEVTNAVKEKPKPKVSNEEDEEETQENGEEIRVDRDTNEPLTVPQPVVQDDDSVHSPEDSDINRESNKRRLTSPSSCHSKQKITDVSELSKVLLELLELQRFRAMLSRSIDDPYTLNKCINALEAMEGITEKEIFRAIKLFEKPHAREAFMSLKSHRRLNWLRDELCSIP